MAKLDFSNKPTQIGAKKEKKESVELKEDKSQIVKIPTSLLDIGENIRNEKTDTELEELADSIKEYGQLEPVIVYKKGDRYTVKIGSRRTKACMIYDIPTVDCIISNEYKDEKERIILQAIENEHRNNMTPKERETYMNQLKDMGLSQIEIAKVLHKPKSWVSEALKALSIREENSDIFDEIEGETSTRATYDFGNFEKEEQKSIIEKTKKDGNTSDAFSKAVKEAKQKKKIEQENIDPDIEEQNESLNESFGIEKDEDISVEFDETDELNDFEGTDIDDVLEDENNEKTLGIHMTFGIDESKKKLTLHSDKKDFDTDIEKYVLRMISNYYIEKGYNIEF